LKGGTARAARRVPKVHKKVFKFSLKVGLQMSHPVWYTYSMMIETDMKEETKTKTVVMSEARRKAKRDITHLTKLGILKKVNR
tara:strand:+ start:2662 stop:2910 length:249 start_codon:yes stop_codon:yes gene_type:complete